MVWMAAPGSQDMAQDTVVSKELVQAEGLFNAFTNEGPPGFTMLDPLADTVSLRLRECAGAARCAGRLPQCMTAV